MLKSRHFLALSVGVSLTGVSSSATACQFSSVLKAEQVNSADVVVIGRVTNYQVIRDEKSRAERREYLRTAKGLSRENRDLLSNQKDYITDYARFTLLVSEVLRGEVPKAITVTWDASTFSEPSTFPSDLRIVGLMKPDVDGGKSATNPIYRERSRFYSVLQIPCSGAFIGSLNSAFGKEVRMAAEEF